MFFFHYIIISNPLSPPRARPHLCSYMKHNIFVCLPGAGAFCDVYRGQHCVWEWRFHEGGCKKTDMTIARNCFVFVFACVFCSQSYVSWGCAFLVVCCRPNTWRVRVSPCHSSPVVLYRVKQLFDARAFLLHPVVYTWNYSGFSTIEAILNIFTVVMFFGITPCCWSVSKTTHAWAIAMEYDLNYVHCAAERAAIRFPWCPWYWLSPEDQ